VNATNTEELLAGLCRLAEDDSENLLRERIQDLKSHGIELRVQTDQEDPEFVTDPYCYTEVVQYCELWIGDAKVHEWIETYWGSFGSMGAGWWVEKGDTSIDHDVERLLEPLELLPGWPDVPMPDDEDD
jgi:hypothetical protein